MDHTHEQTAERFQRFSAILDSAGLRAALADLVSETDYRFIAIFRFEGDRANTAVFFDREHPEVLSADEVPADATYCCLARESRSPFVTDDAMVDARLSAHVARAQVRAYCGVPIITPAGVILGTLCHYDLTPRDSSSIDLALVCEIASALEQGGHVPPYPNQGGPVRVA